MHAIFKAAIVSTAITVIAACGSGSGSVLTPGSAPKAENFNDPDVLAADVAKTIDAKQTDGSTVDVTCIHVSGTQFTCIGVWSDDTPNDTTTVTVSADGLSWISS